MEGYTFFQSPQSNHVLYNDDGGVAERRPKSRSGVSGEMGAQRCGKNGQPRRPLCICAHRSCGRPKRASWGQTAVATSEDTGLFSPARVDVHLQVRVCICVWYLLVWEWVGTPVL